MDNNFFWGNYGFKRGMVLLMAMSTLMMGSSVKMERVCGEGEG
jgi:hypothetical protein